MFCIAAFVVLAILSIFSAKYRKLVSKAWYCTARKTTFRKCDTSFKEDMKAQLLGKLILTKPKLAKFLDKWIEVLAFIFVVLSIWSVASVAYSGLNLYVHGTCTPKNAESCALGAEACSIESAQPGFWQSLTSGKLIDWGKNETTQLIDTIKLIPNRMKKWQPRQYTDQKSSYYRPFDESKPVAIEIVDPGCQFCGQLFRNLKEAEVEERYNLTYMAYPISNPKASNGYKFKHSYYIVSQLEALKEFPLADKNAVPADWQILERIYTWNDSRGVPYQPQINNSYSLNQVNILLTRWLKDLGYNDEQIAAIRERADSQEVKDRIARHKSIVENDIKTLKIPTLLLSEKRFDGVVSTDRLK